MRSRQLTFYILYIYRKVLGAHVTFYIDLDQMKECEVSDADLPENLDDV